MMGLELLAKPGPIPRALLLRLRCDMDHGLFERADIFEGQDFIAMRAAATALGWKETYVLSVRQIRDGNKVGVTRLFVCPGCAKKNRLTNGESE